MYICMYMHACYPAPQHACMCSANEGKYMQHTSVGGCSLSRKTVFNASSSQPMSPHPPAPGRTLTPE